MPITSFTAEDALGNPFPHDEALFVIATVANYHLSKILIDGGSSADILYLSTLKRLMEPTAEGTLEPSLYPLTGFVSKRSIRPLM